MPIGHLGGCKFLGISLWEGHSYEQQHCTLRAAEGGGGGPVRKPEGGSRGKPDIEKYKIANVLQDCLGTRTGQNGVKAKSRFRIGLPFSSISRAREEGEQTPINMPHGQNGEFAMHAGVWGLIISLLIKQHIAAGCGFYCVPQTEMLFRRP